MDNEKNIDIQSTDKETAEQIKASLRLLKAVEALEKEGFDFNSYTHHFPEPLMRNLLLTGQPLQAETA